MRLIFVVLVTSTIKSMLAEEIVSKIDLYTFGKQGSSIDPRIRSTQIIQAAMNPETHLLGKLKIKISS